MAKLAFVLLGIALKLKLAFELAFELADADDADPDPEMEVITFERNIVRDKATVEFAIGEKGGIIEALMCLFVYLFYDEEGFCSS